MSCLINYRKKIYFTLSVEINNSIITIVIKHRSVLLVNLELGQPGILTSADLKKN
jgi:hypothetical protein